MNDSPSAFRRAAHLGVPVIAAAFLGLLAWSLSPSEPLDVGPAQTAGAAAALPSAEPSASSAMVRRDAEVRHGYYAAPVGTALTYGLSATYEYAIGHPEGGRHPSGLQVQADLDLLVADRRDDAIVVHVALRELRLAALAGGGGQDESGMAEAAARPFLAELGLDGSVRGYRFSAQLNGEQRNFVRGLFAAYLHTVPADAPETWEAADADAAGRYVAKMSLAAGDSDTVHVDRRKLRYTEMAGKELHPHQLAGRSRATFSRSLGWLAAVAADERSTLEMAELGVQVELHTVLAVALRGHGRGPVPSPDTDLWRGAWWEAAGHTEDLASCAEASERARWSKLLAGRELNTLIDELAALLAASPQDPQAIDKAWQAIIWSVKLRHEAAAELGARAAAGSEARLADMLVSALGAAGTEAAMDVLVAMRHDPAVTPALRTSATVAMFQLAAPNQRVLGDLVSDIGRTQDLTGDDAMAMLLLGALAPRGGEIRLDGRSALEALVAFAGKAQAQGRLDLWLNALGNAGVEDVLPHAQRFAAHDEEGVRAAAYHALRKVESAAALAVLERGMGDPSPRVRADVVGALGEHMSAAACAALIRAARDDVDADVRRATLSGLARYATPGSRARQALEHLANADPEEANRRAARDVLQGLP